MSTSKTSEEEYAKFQRPAEKEFLEQFDPNRTPEDFNNVHLILTLFIASLFLLFLALLFCVGAFALLYVLAILFVGLPIATTALLLYQKRSAGWGMMQMGCGLILALYLFKTAYLVVDFIQHEDSLSDISFDFSILLQVGIVFIALACMAIGYRKAVRLVFQIKESVKQTLIGFQLALLVILVLRIVYEYV